MLDDELARLQRWLVVAGCLAGLGVVLNIVALILRVLGI
jgi:phage shock protein PspC (stress-responsive transcriptional regulator)